MTFCDLILCFSNYILFQKSNLHISILHFSDLRLMKTWKQSRSKSFLNISRRKLRLKKIPEAFRVEFKRGCKPNIPSFTPFKK